LDLTNAFKRLHYMPSQDYSSGGAAARPLPYSHKYCGYMLQITVILDKNIVKYFSDIELNVIGINDSNKHKKYCTAMNVLSKA
jgi:hypothetical protein